MSNDLVALARAWVGTPHRPGRSAMGRGVHDWGLVREVGIAAQVLEDGAGPDTLIPIAAEDAQPGDVVIVEGRYAVVGEHGGRLTLIRIEGEPGARVLKTKAPASKVVEHGLTAAWVARAEGWFRFPGRSA